MRGNVMDRGAFILGGVGLSFSGRAGQNGCAVSYSESSSRAWRRSPPLRIAIPRDSDDQAIMAAAALDFAEKRESIRLKLVAVEMAESSRALEEGHADLAIVRSDIAMPPSGQTVLIMRRNAAVLL